MSETVNAFPTKRFFIENFTRDLSLEDVVLDLIDNSIDSFIRHNHIELSANLLLGNNGEATIPEASNIELSVSKDEFIIRDNCGGIETELAKDEAFRFGRVNPEHSTSLGVYGIGMKRAVFKIGKKITIESKTDRDGFRVDINVDEWMANEDDWTFPMTRIPAAESAEKAGTSIRILDLNPDISTIISDPTFFKRLCNAIMEAYSLFLNRYVFVHLNQHPIEPDLIPITSSHQVTPARKEIEYDSVQVELIAGLADRKHGWSAEKAGWYVLCNGRIVVNADKSTLTGWGLFGPQYHTKYRGFLGIAFFFSRNPEVLPWTTTKRGLNVESGVYQLTRKEMASIARPVLSFLNDMYPSEAVEEVEERKIVDQLELVELKDLRSKPTTSFQVSVSKKAKRKTTVTVQYKAEKADIEKVKNRINKPSYSASAVGKFTFDHFIKTECAE